MDFASWGLRRSPFERSFAAERFFASPMHEEALARLLFLVEESRRMGILIGPSGTGKTYLLKSLQQRAERLGMLTLRCDALGSDGDELINQIALGGHVQFEPAAAPSRVWSGLRERLAALAVIQQPLVVIIDHFDQVEISCQRTVCRLRQLADAVGVRLTIILATRERFIPTALQDLIELRIDIGPWSVTETAHFVNSAMSQAGTKESPFTEDALEAIHGQTGGIPAGIVTLCHWALIAAMSQSETLITRELIEAANQELMPQFDERGQRRRTFSERSVTASTTK